MNKANDDIENLIELYLDASATTPILDSVLERVVEVEKNLWGNPSSLHTYGLQASESLERSRCSIASSLNASPDEVVFTSGATESNQIVANTLLSKIKPGRIVISSVEHPSLIKSVSTLADFGWEVLYWPVDNFGTVRVDQMDDLLSKPTDLVSVVWGQSEVGTIQPIEIIGKECRKRGILFHTDATQYFSHESISWKDLPIDLLSASAHKFRGPKGVGLLLLDKRSQDRFFDLKLQANQEYGLSSGTQPVGLIAGMAKALEINSSNQLSHRKVNEEFLEESIYVANLTNKLKSHLSTIPNIQFTGHSTNRLINHISMLVLSSNNRPISSSALVRELSKRGLSASSGSACRSGFLTDSPTLTAMKIPKELRQSGLRFTLGAWNRQDDIDLIRDILIQSIQALE